jgi:hypothetical protein
MSQFPAIVVEKALAAFYNRPDVPLVLFGDGGSSGLNFSWPDSDAYGKLTRNHYRVVTLQPIPPTERFLPVSGVYQLERTVAGDSWMWLARDAVIRLPSPHLPNVSLTFRLSPDTPYESLRVLCASVVKGSHHRGTESTEITVTRQPSTVTMTANHEIQIHSDQAFAPATVLHNQDPRIIAVQLIRVVQSP